MSFTDEYIDIIEKTEGDDLYRQILLDVFLKFPSESINNSVRNSLSKLLNKKNKKHFVCGYKGCNEKSCYSHEISENVFLKFLSNEKNYVNVIKVDFKGNALQLFFDPVHKRNASNFPGYCSEHDVSLFSDIEAGFSGINQNFINKHCLRAIRRQLFKLEFHINVLTELVRELKNIDNEDAKYLLETFEKKISINSNGLNRALSLHDYVENGIDTKKYNVNFKCFEVDKKGYMFSSMYDFSYEDEDEYAVIFIIKLETDTISKFIVCNLNNDISGDIASDYYPEDLDGKLNSLDLMLLEKERFVFSDSFIESLSIENKDALLKNNEFYDLNHIDKSFLTMLIF